MLTIYVPEQEGWDEDKEEFFHIKAKTLQLEHSLISLSKWESKWKKPFLASTNSRTVEESIDYIRCMTLTQSVDPRVFEGLSPDILQQIRDYMDDAQTATWFSEEQKRHSPVSRETVTSELIYYWMICYNIPFECQKWHLNRLLTLIQVCGIKQEKPQKLTKSQLAARNSKLNAQRRARLHSKG